MPLDFLTIDSLLECCVLQTQYRLVVYLSALDRQNRDHDDKNGLLPIRTNKQIW